MRQFIASLAVCAILGIVAVVLAGCSVTEYRVVEKTKLVYIPVGKALTTEIVPEAPPDREEYVTASCVQRTTIMSNYSGSVLKTTRDLNNRLNEIEALDAKNKAMVEEANAAEERRVKDIVGNTLSALKREK